MPRWLVSIGLLSSGLWPLGCADDDCSNCSRSSAPTAPEAPTPAVEFPEERIVTDGDTALRNLNSQIDGRRSAVETLPLVSTIRDNLVGLLLSRAAYTGSFDDFDEALELSSEGLRLLPDDPKARSTHASALSAVHQFEEAMALEPDEDLRGPRGDWWIAVGQQEHDVEQARAAEAERLDTMNSWTSWAIALGAIGEYESADTAFARAERAYRDVSPFPLAWFAFQRGVMWSESAGHDDLGRAFYEIAVRRLPSYVVANVHLAELEARDGEVEAAIERLRTVAETTADPEPLGRLGQLLGPETAEGQAYVEEADRRYRDLLERHPRAFLDHASEFYAGPGGAPDLALDLALENLAFRKNARAYRVALEAAAASGDRVTMCRLIEEARSDADGLRLLNVPLAKWIEANDDC